MKVNTINPGKVDINDYLTLEETQSLMFSKADADILWLSRQLHRINPYFDEQGNEGAYTSTLVKLALELRDKAWPATHTKFKYGDRAYKPKGSQWSGKVVGWYSTQLTPEGYCVESELHPGSVQLYPASALEKVEA